MKIKRTINGIEYEFELTEQERFDTYCEQEHIWDVDYVAAEYEEEAKRTCKTEAEIDALIEDIAYKMRRLVNKYGVSEEYALDEAFEEVVGQREEEEEEE